MNYAFAASRHRPNLQGQRPAVAVNPLRYLSHLQGISLLIDLKAVRTNKTLSSRTSRSQLRRFSVSSLIMSLSCWSSLCSQKQPSTLLWSDSMLVSPRLPPMAPPSTALPLLMLYQLYKCTCLQHPFWPLHPFCHQSHEEIWHHPQL